MNENEIAFNEQFEEYFSSGSISKIKEGLAIARANNAYVFMPSPILSVEESFYSPFVDFVFLREDEVYCTKKKYRIHYNGLLRFASAAGFEWSAIDTCRTDNRSEKTYCSFRAVGGVRKADGKVYFHKAEDEIDIDILREDYEDLYSSKWEQVKNCTGNQAWKKDGHQTKKSFVDAMVRRDVRQKQRNKLKLVESGAKARVIRFVLGIQGQYSDEKKVLGMPFIFVSYIPNIKHPEIRRAVTGSFADTQTMIYGGVKETGQIPYMGDDSDAINIPVEPPESEPEPGPGHGPEKSKFQPDQEQGIEDGNLIDFQNITVDEQAETLKKMCKDCNQNYNHYNKQVDGGVLGANQQWRDDFFNFLKEEKEKK